MKLANKAIVVAGGAQGLGRACAERFIADGVKVFITDINAEVLQATADEIGAHHIAADISKRILMSRLPGYAFIGLTL